MGALFKQTLVRTTADQLRRWVQCTTLQVIGASPDGAVDYDRVRYTHPTLLMLGTETSGLTEEQRLMCRHIVRIPNDRVQSLQKKSSAIFVTLVKEEDCNLKNLKGLVSEDVS